MGRLIKKISKTAGLSPGTLVHVGEHRTDKVKITVIDYNEGSFLEKELKSVEESFPFKDSPTVTWLNIDGIQKLDVIEKIGKNYDIHPLVLEDIVNTGQRPKHEDFGKYIFVVLKMLMYDEGKNEVQSEQVSLIVGSNYVISFQEREGDVFSPVRERIRSAKGRIRKENADYLGYSLIDNIVDNYFIILEKLGEKVELIEEGLIADPTPKILKAIHGLKRELISLRKSVWPLREIIQGIEKGESTLVRASTRIYFRDVYDHTIQVIDTVETLRDMVSGMLDIYLSSVSNRMNEVMKVLTIIATIFIPLTFIAGIYGMNFNSDISPWNMPELRWRFGYIAVWGVMAAVVVWMIIFFKRKKWF
ncbi:MAG: magnesium/cobalt transporter CorA [Candidatus Omnitrophica bacterium]|nr:magnesium/cobalt transporter CorA [Candidatus Omnitrophota bacterium]MBU1925180.1 magnesium/cobalt transporter CorA [Candidatus Omnitrophota bacterium]